MVRHAVRNLGLGLLLGLFLPVLAHAQGSIAGVVKDTSAAVLPGVTVQVTSPVLIEKSRSVITDGTGQYKVLDLRPGTYMVTFTLVGFNTVRREGIELTGSFVANVNVEMKVGAIEETVTVSGQTPVVDLQSTTQQRVLNKDTLDAIPTGRLPNSLAVLVPGVTTNTQDVGGRDFGFIQPAISVHGSKAGDTRFTVDGLSPASAEGTGQFTAYMPNMASAQEVAMDTTGASAEQGQSGLKMNLIPRDGGNTFRGTFFGAWANSHLEGNNYTQELKDRKLPAINTLVNTYDLNPGFGGPIVKDRLWFFSAARFDRTTDSVGAAPAYNKNAGDINAWLYVPDTSRTDKPERSNYFHSINTRITVQATPKNKFSAFYDDQTKCNCPFYAYQTGTIPSPESGTKDYGFPMNRFATLTWTAPVTSRLLLDAGISNHAESWHNTYTTDLDLRFIPVNEQSTGMTYRQFSFNPLYSYYFQNLWGFRASLSYVTGAHAFKVGFTDGTTDNDRFLNHDIYGLSYRFQNKVPGDFSSALPNQLTEFATPYNAASKINADLGIYAQDKWTIQRLTLNLGVRFDYFNLYFPPQHVGPGPLTPTRDLSFPETDGITWKDITPRMGVAYDLFGNGKTAVKMSLNKYVSGAAAQSTSGANPVNRLATSTTRTWDDLTFPAPDPRRGNFVPDCELLNTAKNGECAAMSNPNFGLPTPSTNFDPATLNGWRSRGYNWEFSTSVQHEVAPRVSVEFGYFRRAYGNLTITKNLALAPTDFTQFSVTSPTDPNLPGGGGQVISGFYDLNSNKIGCAGCVNNYSTFASAYGEQIDRWNGVDFTINARPRGGVLLQGGVSMGKTLTDNCAVTAQAPEVGTLTAPYCHVESPYLTQMKLLGTYTLPRIDVQISGTFQSIPGPPLAASVVYSGAQTSLGRAFGAGGTMSVNVIPPQTMFGDRLNQLDLRFGKVWRFGTNRAVTSVDLFNALNVSPVLAESSNYANWRQPSSILSPRYARLSLQFDF